MDTNQITRFDFHDATVRVLTDEQGDPWFVGKDVAQVLGYSDANKAVAMHVDNEDKKLNDKTSSSFGQRGATLINESGLYSLILSSKLPQAREFKRWVTSEVLPQIRRTGGYIPVIDPSPIVELTRLLERLADTQAHYRAVVNRIIIRKIVELNHTEPQG